MGRGDSNQQPIAGRSRSQALPLADDGRGVPVVLSAATERERSDYSQGFGHAFALALHDRYGWPLRGVGDPADEHSARPYRGLSYLPDQVYCLTPEGYPVDIFGVHRCEAALQRFYAHQHAHDEAKLSIDLTREQVADELPERGYRPLYPGVYEQTAAVVERLDYPALVAQATSELG